MATKKIGEDVLEPDLLAKILGYNTTSQKDFVDQTNTRINDIQNKKQDISDMKNYFAKTDIVPKANFDSDYVKKIDEHLNHKIEYSDLGSALSSRISGYENSANTATSNVFQLKTQVSSLESSLSNTQTDISNIHNQLSTLETFLNNSSSKDDTSTDSLQNQINSLNSQITSLNTTIEAINNQVSNAASQNDMSSLQTQVSNLYQRVSGISTAPPDGIQGESIILGDNKYKVSRMLLVGKAINTNGSSITSCEAEIAKDATNSYFDFANNVAYVLYQNGDNSYYDRWMSDAVSTKKAINGASYCIVKNAFSSWFGNNKFIIDYSTGAFGVSCDGEYTELSRSSSTTLISNLTAQVNSANARIAALEEKINETT